MTSSLNGNSLYIVINNEGKYLISGTGFVYSTTPLNYICQMLKDTYFNVIAKENDALFLEIVSIKNIGSNEANKLAILDYLNHNKLGENYSIKSILKFNCENISSNISNQTLTLTNNLSLDYLKSILPNELLPNEFNNIYNYLNNVHIDFIVNSLDDGRLYISNPTFMLDKNYYNYLN